MRSRHTRSLVVGAVLALPLLAGCQMSASSSRVFASLASIWSLSASFQSSFGATLVGLDEGYALDIAAVGASAAASAAPEGRLLEDVTRVAESHGVTDWEVLDETWLGLGFGLRHVGLSEAEARALVEGVFGEPMAERTIAAAYVD